MEQELKKLAVELYDIKALKFGDFVTKVGLKTPVYFDLRIIIAYPKLMHKLSKNLWKLNDTKIDQICGVPYTALPIATAISIDNNIPMLIKRKEAKDYGTRKLIEGKFEPGNTCVIIEDVVTSGSSILETVSELKKEGLKINQALVVIDREQGGKSNLENNGIIMRNLFTLSSLMQYLKEAGKIDANTVKEVADYIKNCQAPIITTVSPVNRKAMTFSERSLKTINPMASKLFQLMDQKKTTLCLAADLTKSDNILKLADLTGPHIAVFKIHVDIIEDISSEFFENLQLLSKNHNFLIMEDRKFGDIGNTVALQFAKGVFKVCNWADLVTVHCVAGPGSIAGIKELCVGKSRGIFLITEMSSKGTLTTGNYIKDAVSIAEQYKDFVVGHVCQSDVFNNAGFVQMTPGVKLSCSTDNLGQQYNTPEIVVRNGADLVVVGRGIINENNQLAATLEYKNVLWNAYEKRVKQSS